MRWWCVGDHPHVNIAAARPRSLILHHHHPAAAIRQSRWFLVSHAAPDLEAVSVKVRQYCCVYSVRWYQRSMGPVLRSSLSMERHRNLKPAMLPASRLPSTKMTISRVLRMGGKIPPLFPFAVSYLVMVNVRFPSIGSGFLLGYWLVGR
jgi:hypothetical protein